MLGKNDGRRFDLHGVSVRIENSMEAMESSLDRFRAAFGSEGGGGGIAAVAGTIRPFDASEVLRNVMPQAAAVGRVDDLADVFGCDERFWVVDDRWGICQINLLKHQWRAWMLPDPVAGPARRIEGAVLWPLAQLLKSRGLELIPGTSIEKEGWGALILCSWNLAGEIRELEIAGYRVIGREWSAVRPREHRMQLLGMPELTGSDPRRKFEGACECSAVFIVEPARRAVTRGRPLGDAEASAALRRAWPMIELPPGRRRPAGAAVLLARRCRCMTMQLSKNEADFVEVIESSRRRTVGAKKVMVAINPSLRRASQAIRAMRSRIVSSA
jgi:hypothetical protein